VGRELDAGAAQTMAFATLALSELAFVFSCRSPDVAAWRAPRNPWLVGGVMGSLAVVALAVYLPGADSALGTTPLGPAEAAIVVGLAAVPFVLVEMAKALRRRR
jgi:magnesium-transporting ATPase (P-type)